MRKFYSSFCTLRSTIFILFFLIGTAVNAQTPMFYKTGTGTGGNTIPLNQASQKTQLLYTPTDFNAVPPSGNITKIWFRNSAAGVSGTYNDLEVSFLQNTDPSFPSTSYYTGLTPALTAASLTVTANAAAGGWFSIDIPSPYYLYDNSKSLIVEIKYTSKVNGISTTTSVSVGNKRCSGQVLTATTGTTNTTHNDFGIDIAPAGPCVNPPVPGTITASSNPVCIGVPFSLSISGGTDGSGQTLQWQSSTDNVIYTDIAGATASTLNTSQTVPTWYKVKVTCGVTVESAPLFVNTPAGVVGTFTINNNAPASSTNFQSFNAAYNFIQCGIIGPVIFNVDPLSGPYNEQLIMTPVSGASAANTVTFNGNGRTLSFNSTVSGQRGVIKLDGADHIRFNDLVITAPGTATTEYGIGVHLINNADSNIINNCTININTTSTSTNYAGIAVSASHTSATGTGSTLSDGNMFTNNTINGGYYGITLIGGPADANQNTVIKGNTISDFYFYGVYVNGSFGTLIDSNRISRPARATVSTFNGIYFTALSINANVTRNVITNPFGGAPTSTSAAHGIFFTGVDALAGLNNYVTNNLLFNFTGRGEVNALNNTGSDNVLYYHNTISLDGTSGTGVARGFYQTTLGAGIEFVNNIITVTRDGAGAKYAIYFNTPASDIISNNNDFFLNTAAGNDFTGFFTTARATLADWQAASGDDATSIATNPLYQDIISENYKPTNASINDQGIPAGVLIDITGATRSLTTPDLGAYEFTPSGCTIPPSPGNAVVSNTPVCTLTNVQLTLTSSSTGAGQSYQWETSTSATGPFTAIGNILSNPDTTIVSSTTLYYRVAVTCSGNTAYSTPVLLTVNGRLAAGTYSINAGGPAGTDFISFNSAKGAMLCGIDGPVIFNVAANSGPYNEQLILDSIPGTSAINTITFNGNGNRIAFSSNATDERAVIKFRGADHITFDSLIIDATGTGTYGFGVQLMSNADSNRINNCTLIIPAASTATNFAGIAMSATAASATATGNTLCDGNIFSNNTISGGYYGITMVGSTTALIANNQVINNTIREFYLYGIYLSGNSNALVEGNNLSRPSRTDVSTFNGVYVTSLNESLKVSRNRIHNPFGGELTSTSVFNGIYFTGVDAGSAVKNVVSNNVIYNVNGLGAQYGLYNASSSGVNYYYNSISLDDNTTTATSVTHGFYQTTLADGIEFKNNLISINRSSSGEKTAIVYNTTTSDILSDFNNFFVIPSANSFIGSLGTVNYATLPQWRTASSDDASSLATNPFFSSAATGNLTPLSPVLDNKGTPITGITTDINNAVRSATTPDIGAFEFSVPPCATPPTPGAAAASPTSGICMGAPVFLSLQANSTGAGQSYQWQFSTAAAGPYTNLAPVMQFPDTTIFATSTLYYRVAVTCSGNTVFSDPVLVTINPAFLGGDYTINPANPPFYPAPGSTNFESFTTAVAALNCGITDAVNFYVAPGTYTEQVRMFPITGTSPTKRVTFMSANGNPSSVTLTFNSAAAASNYVLKLDSASYITYKNMTITASNATNGRAVELAGTASYDSIKNVLINVPSGTATTNAIVGIYADVFKGSNNVIQDNTITNGYAGIYFDGTAIATLTYDNTFDNNTINNSYTYGIYIGFNGRANVNNNKVNLTAPRAATSYGIYSSNSDSAFNYRKNEISMDNLSTTTYGLYFTACDASMANKGMVLNNKILAAGNTGTIYGMYQTATENTHFINNVISIQTSGATSYASYSTTGTGNAYYNNTFINNSTSATNNVAAYFAQSTGLGVNIRNNIFAHYGGGRAMYVTNPGFMYSDYNTFYTTGATLIQYNAGNNYATLKAWRDASFWDFSSIAIEPALISITDPKPDIADPDVWAIHGRGVQIEGNDKDFNGAARPVTLTTGVPDMGAYEFLPTALPTVLTPTPATPVAGGTQIFMYGTDTVMKINYAAAAPVPASITLRRYSGVIPPGLATGQRSMYFYTDVDVPAQGAYNFTMQKFFVDSWQGFIENQNYIKLGKTDAANAWAVDPASTVNPIFNVITTPNLSYLDKFTGLRDANVNIPPVVLPPSDTSNRGTRFWVGYGHHQNFETGNSQDMILYFSAEQAANVVVKVNGTPYQREYSVPANSVITSETLPKSGLYDSRLLIDGKSTNGISIESDVPIVAYAHIYASTTSEAAMLLPVGTYGYEYTALTTEQNYAANTYSWFYVVADNDSTKVTITPSNPTLSGDPAGVPFDVYLNKGEIYQALGAIISGSDGYDLTGSTIKAVQNANGKCYPVAVFSGSSRTNIGCGTSNPTGSGDNILEQNFPFVAWGKKYLVAPTSNSTSASSFHTNIYRVAIKDPTTVVLRNGTPLSPLINNFYYEFESNTADVIEANKPFIVAQIMSSATYCANTGGGGDPAMVYVSPVEQGIKRTGLYRNTQSAITTQYVTLIIPTAGVASLRIDGSATFDHTYPHTNQPGYTVVVKRWSPASNAQVIIESDSAFTAITYGLGSVESYAYNGGTLVKNLTALPAISNTLATGGTSTYTCVNAPFEFSTLITIQPTVLTWQFSQVPNLSPAVDVVQNNPVPVSSVVINGRTYYRYTIASPYAISVAGNYVVPILITHPDIEGCSNTLEISLEVEVLPAPVANFTTTGTGCLGSPLQFNGTGTSANGTGINTWTWTFGDNTGATGQNPSHTYLAPGVYDVTLDLVGLDGCIGDTTKQIVISTLAAVEVVEDSLVVCGNTPVTFQVQTPVPGTIYEWYTSATGGTPVFTGNSYTIPNVTGLTEFYVQATNGGGCISDRKRVVANLEPVLIPIVAVADSIGADRIRFSWNAVPNALTYEISTDNGVNWVAANGANSLSHTVMVQPLQTVTLIVRARGAISCQESVSAPVSAVSLPDGVFIPNAFSPNGDGRNDVLLVYGYTIQSMRMIIFNQWGEKIFESNNQTSGWNGTHQGKPQPSGVYMYVCEITLRDGSKDIRKGSINLVR